jgi:hypothetical protein
MVFSNNGSYIVRVAMSAEFAGFSPTQNPGKLSKMATFTEPPCRVDAGCCAARVFVPTASDAANAARTATATLFVHCCLSIFFAFILALAFDFFAMVSTYELTNEK